MTNEIGRIGAWLGALSWAPAAEAREAVAELDELGYGAVWIGEAHGRESFTHSALLLAASQRIVVATGITNVWGRDAFATVAATSTLAEAYPGRFLLGLGISHPHVVAMRGHEYARPLANMREYLDAMDAVAYAGPQPPQPASVVLAALRPRMLELARDRTDGAHPYLVPPEHTRRAREILGPDRLLAPEQAVLLETDPQRARELGRAHVSFYLSAPSYRRNLLWLGFDEEDLAGGGSDRLVDAIVAWGDEEAVVRRVTEHLDAGADHVGVQPLGPERGLCLDVLRRLAPALLRS